MDEFQNHAEFMRYAINLAKRGRWTAAPNPTVGAVLVSNGHIAAEGWHQCYGKEHAEIRCLQDAERKHIDPSECTLYVTLEPCNHFGKTPPCSRAIVKAGIKNVIIGAMDINTKASGGADYLREHGVNVTTGILEKECLELIEDFSTWQSKKRPYVILKMASTIDGRIASAYGASEIISGEYSHREVMRLRGGIGLAGGAILIGMNTFVTDNPQLTSRGLGYTKQPKAIVLGTRLPEPQNSFYLLQKRAESCIFLTTQEQANSNTAELLRKKGVTIYGISNISDKQLNLAEALSVLFGKEKIPYILCEGGGKLACSLLRENLVDLFYLHMAPIIAGDSTAKSLFNGNTLNHISESIPMRVIRTELHGSDIHITFKPSRV